MGKKFLVATSIGVVVLVVMAVGVIVFSVNKNQSTQKAIQMTKDYCNLNLTGLPKGVDCGVLADTYLKLYRDEVVNCSQTYSVLGDFGSCILDHYSDVFYTARGT